MDEEVKLMNKVLQNEKYEAVAKLSEGSYGQIFLVQHRQLKKRYVMKTLDIEKLKKQNRLHETIVQSAVLKRINHPGIIKIYQTFQKQKYFAQILDYCPYGDVYNLISKLNMKLNLAIKKKQITQYYLAQILEALNFLHSRNIIHRDLKPQNIVVAQNSHIKLIDFGTAQIDNADYLNQQQQLKIKSTKSNNQQDKDFVGSAHYLAPQVLKCQYSQKSDIWAYGVIVYKFYHNSLPFVGANNFQIFKAISGNQPQLDNEIPPEIKEVILACLKKNAKDRPTTYQLKNYNFFKSINFQKIFEQDPPLLAQQLNMESIPLLSKKKSSKFGEDCFSLVLQKKMFFGNYKPRILVIRQKNDRLYFAYKYVDTQITKNQVELNMNDYCQKLNNKQFQIKCDDKNYQFKLTSNQKDIEMVVEQINDIIKSHFCLN